MSRLNHQIQKHNTSMQQLRKLYSYSFDRFLKEGTGNLVITGGEKQRRRQVLLRQIEWYRNHSNDSVVVFSNDTALKTQLIQEANAGTIGQLYIIDSLYPNYDFFTGMPLNLISEYFSKAAIQRGCRDTSKLLAYTDAFLKILSSQEEVSLQSIRKMLTNDDAFISSLAPHGWESDCIISSLEGGGILRDLATVTTRAFSPLASHNNRNAISLMSGMNLDSVIFVDVPTLNHDLYAIYFAMELRGILQKSFKIIFDDELMINSKELSDTIRMIKQRQADVILSYENIISIQSPQEDILDNIERRIVFLNGKMPAVDLQQVLSRFGQFTAIQAMDHRDSPPAYFFTLLRGKGEAPLQYQRDRVLLQELTGIDAVLSSGSNPEIVATKKLYITKED